MIRYQDLRTGLDNQGAGDFNLASRAYNVRQTERVLQITETATLSPRIINETRFEYLHSTLRSAPVTDAPGIDVQGAFFGGGATVGELRFDHERVGDDESHDLDEAAAHV